VPGFPRSRPAAAGVLGCASLLLIGWTGLLVPSLIRSVKEAFDQSDAGIGIFYFLYAVAYAAGSFGGGPATERLGRRTVLGAAVGIHAIGLVALGLAPSWEVFLVAALPGGLGAGAVDGGVNGLFLDRFRTGRGRALNLLHLFFSLGALSAPLAVGVLVDGGVGWQEIIVVTGLIAIPVALLFGIVPMPSGRRRAGTAAAMPTEPTDRSAATELVSADASQPISRAAAARGRLAAPLILLGVAIGCYVASEVGVSNWLVRFLEPAPLSTATTALSLYWAGLAAGRLVSSQLADRLRGRDRDRARRGDLRSIAAGIDRALRADRFLFRSRFPDDRRDRWRAVSGSIRGCGWLPDGFRGDWFDHLPAGHGLPVRQRRTDGGHVR